MAGTGTDHQSTNTSFISPRSSSLDRIPLSDCMGLQHPHGLLAGWECPSRPRGRLSSAIRVTPIWRWHYPFVRATTRGYFPRVVQKVMVYRPGALLSILGGDNGDRAWLIPATYTIDMEVLTLDEELCMIVTSQPFCFPRLWCY